uniref:Uncharacterized protein n=1 Tax=Anguilla anguilla TaxID=7936 RepID=A0A0E9R5Z5_ANGAN
MKIHVPYSHPKASQSDQLVLSFSVKRYVCCLC